NGTPNGTWSVSGGQYGNNGFNIGTGLSTSFTFPSVGTYTICYTYTDADGCDKECCKTICISGDPYDCDLIQQVYDASSNTWTLSVPNVAGSRVDFWQNDITFQRFGQGQLSVSVSNPPAGECAYYSVKIFDPACGGYKLCCLEICNTGCGSANFIDIKCTDDSTKYDLQIAVNNTSGRSNVDVEFTILSPLGVTFQGCQNYIKVNNIGTSTNPNLQLEGCLVPLIAGMTIRIKVSLVDGDPTSNWCCHLEDIVVTIPECETCIGEPDPDLNCIDVYEPVCGCDGLTYSNECYAQREGVLQWTTGECPCQGEPKDIDCAAVYEPVCGCDGMTYSNDCFAAAAGISSWTAGECPCTGANLVINGDFEQGNSAFSSSLPSNCSCDVGSYCIAAKARDKCNNPATWTNVTSSGNYMVIDARDNVPYDLWSQGNINVTGGQTYDFTFDLYPNISFNGSPTLELWINGSAVLTNIQGTPNQWNTIMSSWTAPSSGSISLAIRITQTGPTGDFGIDNIKFVNCGSGNNAEQHQIESRTASSATISLTNFPNPFHNSTTIAFTLPNESEASLEIFDTNGKVVYQRTEVFEQGKTEIEFQANDLDAGVYIYRLQTDQTVISKSMVLIQE
ncbi:MAG: T9SS type A sorting domain-containing protein, partial [Bacteroidota bacterium]